MSRFGRRSRFARRLVCELLEARVVACASSYTFAAGELGIICSSGEDVVVVDRAFPDGVHLTLNEHRSEFSGSGIRRIAIRGLDANDIVLIDPSVGLPVLVEGTIGGVPVGGWLSALQTKSPHSNGGIDYLVVTADFLTTGQVPVHSSSDMDPADDDMLQSLATSGLTPHGSAHALTATPSTSRRGGVSEDGHESNSSVSHGVRPSIAAAHTDARSMGTGQTYKVHKPG